MDCKLKSRSENIHSQDFSDRNVDTFINDIVTDSYILSFGHQFHQYCKCIKKRLRKRVGSITL